VCSLKDTKFQLIESNTFFYILFRETSHGDHFAGSRSFYYSRRLRGDKSESGDKLYNPRVVYVTGVFAVDGSQMVRKTSQLQRNKLVQSFPSIPLQTVVTVTGKLAGPS
jgi:hypothetical protein